MIQKFYELWKLMRIAALALALIVMAIMAAKCHCHTLEIEYVGPGSEADRNAREVRDRDNERAYERVMEGSSDPRDIDRAIEHWNDHGA